jgi:hypothetical protein
MRRVCALAALCVGCAIAGVSFASDGAGHGLKPPALAFMRAVTIPDTGAPLAVRNAFAEHPLAGSPRRALAIGAGRTRTTLWVAPLRRRGWCSALQGAGPLFVHCSWWKGFFGPFGAGLMGPALFVGRAAVTPGRELRLVFGDGASRRIRTRDGFFLYRAPGRLLLGSFPHALVLRDGRRRLAHLSLLPARGADLPVGGIRRPPGSADTRRARAVASGTTKVGAATVLMAPSRLRPATCWWLRIGRGVYGGGCARTDRDTSTLWSVAPVRLRVRGREVWVLWGHLGQRFASLDLRFQDGVSKRLRLTDGYFLYLVPSESRRAGRRPAVVVARRADGGVGRRQPLYSFTWAPYGP